MTQETLYLRGKMAERGTSKAKFSRDGFDFWAETEAPARAGQVEKVASESTTPTMQGDALKRLYARHQSRQRRGGAEGVGDGLEKLQGDAIKMFGYSIPTSLTEAKQMAKENPEAVRMLFEFVKSKPTIKKYVPSAILDFFEMWASGQGYLAGDGTKKGMVRKTSRRAFDKLQGDAIKMFGYSIPTSLTEAKQMAKENPEALRMLFEFVKSKPTIKKYVPSAILDFFEMWASGQGYLAGGRVGRKASRHAFDKLQGDAIKMFGYSIPTSLTEAKQMAKENPEALRMLFEFVKSKPTIKKYVPSAILDFFEMWASGQGYLAGGKAISYELPIDNFGRKIYPKIPEKKNGKSGSITDITMEGGRKARKPSSRNMIVKELMMKEGLSLPEASKQVKLRGLY